MIAWSIGLSMHPRLIAAGCRAPPDDRSRSSQVYIKQGQQMRGVYNRDCLLEAAMVWAGIVEEDGKPDNATRVSHELSRMLEVWREPEVGTCKCVMGGVRHLHSEDHRAAAHAPDLQRSTSRHIRRMESTLHAGEPCNSTSMLPVGAADTAAAKRW